MKFLTRKQKLLIQLFLLGFTFLVLPDCIAQSFSKSYEKFTKEVNEGKRKEAFESGHLILTKHLSAVKKEPIKFAEITNAFGNYYYSEKNLDSAITCFYRASEIVKAAVGDTAFDYAFYLNNIALVYAEVGYYKEAENLYFKTLPILAKNLGQSSIEYTLFFKEYVEMKIDMGDFTTAKSYNDGLIYYFKTLYGSKNQYYVQCLNSQARIAQGIGDYEGAQQTFEEILAITKSEYASDTINLATLYNNTAESYRVASNYEKSGPYYNEAYKLYSSMAVTPIEDIASLLNNMGLNAKASGDYYNAERLFLKSIEYYKLAKLDRTISVTNPLSNLGDLYRLIFQYDKAYEMLSAALYIRKATAGEEHEYYANTLNNMAILFQSMGLNKEADSALQKCKEIYYLRLGDGNPRYANCLSNLASINISLKQYTQAESYFKQAIQLASQTYGEKSDRYANYVYSSIDLFLAKKNYTGAIEKAREASSVYYFLFGESNLDYIKGKLIMANCFQLMGVRDSAKKYFLETVYGYQDFYNKLSQGMTEDEKMRFLFQFNDGFNKFNDFVLTTQLTNKDTLVKTLFNIRLLSKSLLLNESSAMQKAISSASDTSIVNLYHNWLDSKKTINSLYRFTHEELELAKVNLDEIETYSNDLEKKLQEYSNSFGTYLTRSKADYIDILKQLKKGEAAVEIIKNEYYRLDTIRVIQYAALILRPELDAPLLVNFDSSAFFDEVFLNQYAEMIQNKVPDYLSYNRFFKKLEPHLKGVNKIYLSGDGAYHKINLYTLFDSKRTKYLLDVYEFNLLTNLNEMLDIEQEGLLPKSAELYGYPDYEYDFVSEKSQTVITSVAASRFGFIELAPLPGTEKEVNEIALSLKEKGWKVDVYKKNEASEEQLKRTKSPSILHVATHGFFLPNLEYSDKKVIGFNTEIARSNPLLRSGVIMAGAAVISRDTLVNKYNEDGILTAYEAATMDLRNTELVTLSACETGLGDDIINGQGVYGLQRSFLVAGAKSVMMSLWVVDDYATQELMSVFYKEWASDFSRLNKKMSFRKAQQKVKEKYNAPYYWGAFIMVGK